ncbi:MAG: HNH endonuclease [Actinomycetota bacterium]|nr:HNH endonuclease [Actinomycetota bacterium]
MSELRSVIEALQSEVLSELSDAQLEQDFAEVQRAAEMLEVERLRRLAEIERRRVFERDGHLNTASWLSSTFKMGWGAAKEQIKTAAALEEMPETRRALDEGELSTSAARVLVQAREADPSSFQRSEAELVEAAKIHSMQDLKKVASYWQKEVEKQNGLDSDEKVRARRRLNTSIKFLGIVQVDGELDPETGETLLTALRAVLDAEAKSGGGDDRTPEQKRADALGEICRQWLDSSDRPKVGGERPHVVVTVGEDALKGAEPGETRAEGSRPTVTIAPTELSELDHVGPTDWKAVRLITCDASIRRVVMAAPSEPLDVGRRTPVIPPAMRRAVILRDRHCRHPGCRRPAAWSEVHHIVHWADGGPTALPNLILLCRRHHRMVHEGKLRLELGDGRPVFRRPDGSLLENRAPP